MQNILLPHVKRFSIVGSLRRQEEEIGDIDYLVIMDGPVESLIDSFEIRGYQYDDSNDHYGQTKLDFITPNLHELDIITTDEMSWGAAQAIWTGPRSFNKKLELQFDMPYDEIAQLIVPSEEEFFIHNGIPYLPPEQRQ